MVESTHAMLERIERSIREDEIEAEVAKRLAAVEAERTAREAAAAARPRRSKMTAKQISDFLTKYGQAEFNQLPR